MGTAALTYTKASVYCTGTVDITAWTPMEATFRQPWPVHST